MNLVNARSLDPLIRNARRIEPPDNLLKVASIRAAEVRAGIQEAHQTIFLHHGDKTKEAHIIFHGLGNTTHDLEPLAQALFRRGHNVLVARTPLHGCPVEKRPIARLRLKDLITFSRIMAETGDVIGEKIHVAGFSLGAAIALAVAAFSEAVGDVDLIAPVFGPRGIPRTMLPLAEVLYTVRPDTPWMFSPRIPAPGRSTRAAAVATTFYRLVTAERSAIIPAPERIRIFTPPRDRLACPKAHALAVRRLASVAEVHCHELPPSIHAKPSSMERVTPVGPDLLQVVAREHGCHLP